MRLPIKIRLIWQSDFKGEDFNCRGKLLHRIRIRNIQERETQEVDEKEVSISEKQKSDKDLTLIRK